MFLIVIAISRLVNGFIKNALMPAAFASSVDIVSL